LELTLIIPLRCLRERVEQRVKPAVFHYIEGDAMQPMAECERYTQMLLAQIDLCCLGLEKTDI